MSSFPSLGMRLTTLLLRTQPKLLADAQTYRQIKQHRTYPQPASLPDSLQLLTFIREEEVDGQVVYTLKPKAGRSDWHFIYTHGGVFVEALISPHWYIIEQLILHTGATVTVPLYPLTPEHTYRETFPLLTEVYRQVLASTSPEKVILCGDSAGGNLALTQALHYRDLGLPLPGRLLLFSPWLDLSMSNPEMTAIEPHDPMLARPGSREAAKWWAGGDDLRLPLLSPLHADLRGLPPMDVFQGELDILWPDTRRLAQQVQAAGGTLRLHPYPGAFHVFMAATYTPEAQDVFRQIGRLLSYSPRAVKRTGLIKLVSLPPVRLVVYLSERAQQRRNSDAPREGAGKHRPLGILLAVLALWLWQRRK
ncbi:alpha/beta hydrolase [Deinococcus sp. QL22]|uniref:alpha/beta hydrolase n=1 Tax=Deinococcus sp. QL22 TaxID=2939437 RepID=UPI002017A45B|nr:alpha/beta hydrolase [Deinococcus sp. QL22]UQN09354.1 alpha/beta hydrolase [Deinococcus sp. QL22]